jgi:iron complex outermembrane receptor protein
MDAHRGFKGAGVALDWEIDARIADLQGGGSVGLDAGIGAGVLWGTQKVLSHGQSVEDYFLRAGTFASSFWGTTGPQQTTTTTSLEISRSETATVPTANANLGLTYSVGGLKVSGGYRVERYFNAIDGGILTRKTYDRQYDGPYFKVSVGFGG